MRDASAGRLTIHEVEGGEPSWRTIELLSETTDEVTERLADRSAEGVERRREPAGGWRFRPLQQLAKAQAAHAAGDAAVAVALADTLFFSLPLGEARSQVALYLALTMAPFAVLSPLVGPRLDRRRGSYRFGIASSLVARVVLALLLSSRTDVVALYPLAFGLLVASRIHGVSRSALVPEVMPPDRSLMWANAWLAIVSVAGGALGAGVGVITSRWWSTDTTLEAASLIFAVGALASMALPTPEGLDVRRAKARRERRSLLAPRLLAAGLAMAASRVAVGFVVFLFAFLLRAEGRSSSGLVVVAVAGGLGGFVGSAAAPVLGRMLRDTRLLTGGLALTGLVASCAAFDFTLHWATAVAAVVGLTSGAGRLAFDSILQSDAPEALRGRTFTRYETTFQLCWVTGAAVATAVPFTPGPGLGVLAAICAAGLVLSVQVLRGHPVRVPSPLTTHRFAGAPPASASAPAPERRR